MTRDEAQRVLRAILTADGGCGPCASDLLDTLARMLPEERWYELALELPPGGYPEDDLRLLAGRRLKLPT